MAKPLKLLPQTEPIEEVAPEAEAPCDALESELWQRTHQPGCDDWERPEGPAPRVTLRKTIIPPDWDR